MGRGTCVSCEKALKKGPPIQSLYRWDLRGGARRARARCARRAGGGAGRDARLPLREAQRVQGLGRARRRSTCCGAGWGTSCGARAREGGAAARGRADGGRLARRGASGPPRTRRVLLRGGGAWCCCTSRYGAQCGTKALGRRPAAGGRHAWWRRWHVVSGCGAARCSRGRPNGRGSGHRSPTRTSALVAPRGRSGRGGVDATWDMWRATEEVRTKKKPSYATLPRPWRAAAPRTGQFTPQRPRG